METNPSVIPEFITSLIRNALALLAGFLVGKGVINAQDATALSGALLAAVPVVWSLVNKARANKALKSAIASPAGQA